LVHGDDVWQHKFNELARGSEVWLGMTRENKNSEWEWIDGTKAQNIRWQPGQPNNYANDDNCSLLSNRHANDIPCEYLIRFICQAKSVSCPLPESLPNNSDFVTAVSSDDKFALKQMIQFQCTDDTLMSGDPTITCEKDGRFSPFQFECKKKCNPLPECDFAKPIAIENEFPTGTMITYKCWNPLARPAGDPTITCDENGNWSEISFTCDSVCKPPMSISNSEQLIRNESDDFVPISGKLFGVGVTVHYKCKPGYYTRRNKKTQAVCTQSGKWDFINPARCKQGCLLSQSPKVQNAKLIGPGNRYRTFGYKLGASAYYKCKPGYRAVAVAGRKKGKLAKSPTITCSKEGWSMPKSECVKTINIKTNKNRLG